MDGLYCFSFCNGLFKGAEKQKPSGCSVVVVNVDKFTHNALC